MAADSAYRDAREHARQATAVVLMVGCFYLAVGLYDAFVLGDPSSSPLSDGPGEPHWRALLDQGLVGGLFLATAWAAVRWPTPGLLCALALFFLTQLAPAVLGSAALATLLVSLGGFITLFARVAAAILIARGIVGSARADRMLARIRAGPA